jgi:predicted HTH domain antitoxin
MECTRLGFSERYDDQNPMAQFSPQKRKKRRVQLREAQRRRRARLKEESKSFLQIILSQEMLLALRQYSELVGKPLHACAAELIERGLDRPQQLDSQQQRELQNAPILEDLPPPDDELSENGQPIPAPGKSEEAHELSAGQMELFAG